MARRTSACVSSDSSPSSAPADQSARRKERLDLGERGPQPLLGGKPLELGARPCREGAQHGGGPAGLAERLVVQHGQVARHPAGRVQHRDAEIALRGQIDQVAIVGKEALHVGRIRGRLASQDHPTRRRRQVVFEVLGEAVPFPEGEGADSGRIRPADSTTTSAV